MGARKTNTEKLLWSVTQEENLDYSGEFWGGQMVGRVMPDCTLQGKSYRVVARGR